MTSGRNWSSFWLPSSTAPARAAWPLGLIGGIGLIILVFGFHLKPGKPPVDVILTILSVICASAALQAAGGLDCLLQIAEKMLRKHPRAVCFLAPYLCWFLALLCGTGHVVYTMLPIIYDVAIKNGIRPERRWPLPPSPPRCPSSARRPLLPPCR